jgi:putative DNA primase/helicase
VPLELDLGDRRFFVLYCGDVPDQVYFDELFQEINNGGIEAFYGYLMSLDFGEFSPHSKPPLNAEKQHLIEASLPAAVLFYREWADGLLEIPFCSCRRSDLFEEFKRWCEKKNEFKKRDRDFVGEVRRYMDEARKDITMTGHAADRKTDRIWVTPEDKKHESSKDYVSILEKSCKRFYNAIQPNNQQG